MAKEEKKPVPAKKNSGEGNRFVRVVTAIPRRMRNAILNSIAELKKVTWPGLKDLRNYTAIVLVFMVLMAVIIGVLDLGASNLMGWVIRLGG